MHRLLIPLLFLLIAGCSDPLPPNVKVTREPAAGLTVSDMDQEYLDGLLEWTRREAARHLQESYKRNEVPPEARTSRPYVEGRYRTLFGQKLAVVWLSYSGSPVRVVRVTGLEGAEQVTVACTEPGGAPIDLEAREAPCGRVLRQTFQKEGQ